MCVYWAYQAAKYEIYLKRIDAVAAPVIVAAFRAAPEIRDEYARLHLENGKSCEKSLRCEATPLALRL